MQKRGFTLLEMLVTIGFVLVLAGTVAVFGITSLKLQEVDRAVQTIRNNLVAARDQAMSARESSRWGVEFATSSIMSFKGSTYATRDHSYDLFNPFAPGINITGISEIVFVPPFGNAATSGSVTITDGDRTVSISVNPYGMIQAQ
jgi:type II secretory pathway pseudopilin PulG